MCMNVWPACIYIYTQHTCLLDPLELGLQTVVSHHLGAGTGTWSSASALSCCEPSPSPVFTILTDKGKPLGSGFPHTFWCPDPSLSTKLAFTAQGQLPLPCQVSLQSLSTSVVWSLHLFLEQGGFTYQESLW